MIHIIKFRKDYPSYEYDTMDEQAIRLLINIIFKYKEKNQKRNKNLSFLKNKMASINWTDPNSIRRRFKILKYFLISQQKINKEMIKIQEKNECNRLDRRK